MAPASLPRTVRSLVVAGLSLGVASGCASDTPSGGARLGQAASWSSVAGGPPNSSRAHAGVSDSPELLWSRTLGAPAIGVQEWLDLDRLRLPLVQEMLKLRMPRRKF